jgi:tRNA modification GTPase
MSESDTIFALSSARGKAGVCVMRISGSRARVAVAALTGRSVPGARVATLRRFVDARGEPIDRGLVVWFPAPHSFTGEDVAEFHAHGSPAVVAALVARLGQLNGLRPAESGEFTRRAFANNKFDLTEAEGLADLIAAETEQQRRQALRQMDGALRECYERWREALIKTLAHLEAVIDFPEEDLPRDLFDAVGASAVQLMGDIDTHLADQRRGEIVRDGFSIVIVGAPNVGKSSLMNALAARDIAIVTETAGTTRDLIEVDLDLGGYAVTLVDTAGLRETSDAIESEGIARARKRAAHADMRLAVIDATAPELDPLVANTLSAGDTIVANKIDLSVSHESGTHESDAFRVSDETALPMLRISARDGNGIDALLSFLAEQVIGRAGGTEAAPLTRLRHRNALEAARDALARSVANLEGETRTIDLAAEDLRIASRELGRITGRVDVEDLLDVIFRDFCIGK